MIKVIEEKEVPRRQVECQNCHSLLEYGNADLYFDYDYQKQFALYAGCNQYYFNCPVCGCKVSASWITKTE